MVEAASISYASVFCIRLRPRGVCAVLESGLLAWAESHLWLLAKVPKDAVFAAQVQEISTLYTPPLATWEVVLSVDEKTNLQPRPRLAVTLPAQRGKHIRLM